jgi:hypothetical protein
MILSREDAVRAVVELLQPAVLSEKDLFARVYSDFEYKENADLIALSSGYGQRNQPQNLEVTIRGGIAFIKAAKDLIQSLENLSTEYEEDILPLLKRMPCARRRDLIELISSMANAVEVRKAKLTPRRGGGAVEARDEKSRKEVCAIFALSLLSQYHTKRVTCGAKRYLEITAVLAEYFEGLPNADTRRACEKIFNELRAHEQDDG